MYVNGLLTNIAPIIFANKFSKNFCSNYIKKKSPAFRRTFCTSSALFQIVAGYTSSIDVPVSPYELPSVFLFAF